jgi:hypothetical protein
VSCGGRVGCCKHRRCIVACMDACVWSTGLLLRLLCCRQLRQHTNSCSTERESCPGLSGVEAGSPGSRLCLVLQKRWCGSTAYYAFPNC